jgi:MFS family permease
MGWRQTGDDCMNQGCLAGEIGMARGTERAHNIGGALIVLLGAAVFLNYVDRGAIGIAAPLMKSELTLTATQFGLVASAFFWVYAPVQLIVGWLVDRFSVYRLMAGGLVLWATATLAMGFVGGFTSLLLLRILLGIGETIAFPGGSKIITRHVPPERRGMANAAMALGIALGPAAGTLAGGLILASFGWRAIFIAFGLVTLVWLVPWHRATRTLELRSDVVERRVPVAALIGKWPLWSMSIAHIASNYVFYFLLAWLPLYLVQSRGLAITEMTLLATLGYAVQAVAALTFGSVSDWWTRSGRSEASVRRWMMALGQLAAGLAVLGLAYATTPLEIGTLLVIAGIATGALSLNTYAVAQMFAGPRAAGTWVGIQNAIGNSSGIFGPIVTGIIVDSLGYTTAFVIAAAVAIAGALWWIVGVPRIEQVELN